MNKWRFPVAYLQSISATVVVKTDVKTLVLFLLYYLTREARSVIMANSSQDQDINMVAVNQTFQDVHVKGAVSFRIPHGKLS